MSEINEWGYGSIGLNCKENKNDPHTGKKLLGQLELILQSGDGTVLRASLDVGVSPKPDKQERRRQQDVKTCIIFGTADQEEEKRSELSRLFGEKTITSFSECTYLQKYCDALEDVSPEESTYWAEKSEREGISELRIEINAGHPQLVNMLKRCKTAQERVDAKERYVRDVALDCYQHCFNLKGIPEVVENQIFTDPDEGKRAAEIHLNHDKAIRIATNELKTGSNQET